MVTDRGAGEGAMRDEPFDTREDLIDEVSEVIRTSTDLPWPKCVEIARAVSDLCQPTCETCGGSGWNVYPNIETQALLGVPCEDCTKGLGVALARTRKQLDEANFTIRTMLGDYNEPHRHPQVRDLTDEERERWAEAARRDARG